MPPTAPNVAQPIERAIQCENSRLSSDPVPACLRCGGILKPDVVMFGENVPKERVEQAFDLLAEARVLLVVGSSLATYSGLRFVTRAVQDGKDVAIVNRGPTRGDQLAAVRIEAALGDALPACGASSSDADRGAAAGVTS